MVHAALLLLMLEAVTTDLVSTISLKRSTQNLQLSTSWPADYPIYLAAVDRLLARDCVQMRGEVFLKSSIAPAACA
jgi:hypothetical protein